MRYPDPLAPTEADYERMAEEREDALPPSLAAICAAERAEKGAEYREEPFPQREEPRYPRDVWACRTPDGDGWWRPRWALDLIGDDR